MAHGEIPVFVLPQKTRGKRDKPRLPQKLIEGDPRPQDTRIRTRLKRYGMTPDDYQALIKTQENCCPVCGKRLPMEDVLGYKLPVDHNHKTGKVRGVVHTACNMLLGLARDDVQVLLKATQYVLQQDHQGAHLHVTYKEKFLKEVFRPFYLVQNAPRRSRVEIYCAVDLPKPVPNVLEPNASTQNSIRLMPNTCDYCIPPGGYGVFDLEPCGPNTGAVVIRMQVLAGSIVNLFVVNNENLNCFKNNLAFGHYGPGTVTDFYGQVPLGTSSKQLVVENAGAVQAQVRLGFQVVRTGSATQVLERKE